jgi:hypothetical protein
MRRFLLVLALLAISCHSAPTTTATSSDNASNSDNSMNAGSDNAAPPSAPGEAPAKMPSTAPAPVAQHHQRQQQMTGGGAAKYKLAPGSLLCRDNETVEIAEAQKAQGQAIDPSSGCMTVARGAEVTLYVSNNSNARVRLKPVGIDGWTRMANLQKE